MKITNRFVEPIPLTMIEDAADGSRKAMRPEAQTFEGTKTFEHLQVASDADKGDKSLVNVADMEFAIAEAGMPLTVVDTIVLTTENISSKSAKLSCMPQENQFITFSLEGSGEYVSVSDFDVDGDVISWADNEFLCEELAVDDELYVTYKTLKKE